MSKNGERSDSQNIVAKPVQRKSNRLEQWSEGFLQHHATALHHCERGAFKLHIRNILLGLFVPKPTRLPAGGFPESIFREFTGLSNPSRSLAFNDEHTDAVVRTCTMIRLLARSRA
jgi:hypothetical protein